MSDLLIKGMEMPPTGVYIVSIDNSDKDKPVLLICSPKKDGDTVTNTVIACREMLSIPSHGRLIDADKYEFPGDLIDESTIIPASE